MDSSKANPTKQDLLHLLTMAIHKANIVNPSNFSSSSYLNIEKPKTYK